MTWFTLQLKYLEVDNNELLTIVKSYSIDY